VSIFESISSAIGSVMSNKMRSVLTMLGIIIGISAVIMITSIGQGFQDEVNTQFESLGSVGLQVSVRFDTDITENDLLTMEDVDLILSHPDVTSAAPVSTITGRVQLKNPTESARVNFFGSTEAFRNVQPVEIRHGRFLADIDVDTASPVIIIDESLARRIFGRANVVGETISCSFWFGHADFVVIGVYRIEDFGVAMFEMPSISYIPITSLMKISNNRFIDTIFVSGRDRDNLDQTAAEINRLLSIKNNNERKYRVQNLLQQMEMVNDIIGYITSFVGLVAAISLIVGGIGVMNIMLVTVTERTREIGIRKALGATDANIQMQFLIEAVILTAIGGFIGIIVGYVGGFFLGDYIGLAPAVSIPTVAGTVAISSAIGIIFGVYPAGKAAKLDPIEALRYE
jgi:putative ABC transport system permease protein